jgi:phosphate transport system permease protein
MMSLIALPPMFTATRDGLQAVPAHMREAAFALGKTRIATIRRVLLPSVRSNIATGVTLGVSRIIGDTAIVVLLLGESLRLESQGSAPVVGMLRGTGSTLTSYVYDNSPAGEGAAPQKAYAAAFVLLVLVLGLNLLVDRIGRSQADSIGLTAAGAIVELAAADRRRGSPPRGPDFTSVGNVANLIGPMEKVADKPDGEYAR